MLTWHDGGRWHWPGEAALRELQGKCGSSVAFTFSFVRWVAGLNAVLAVLMLFTLLFPFFAHPPDG